MELSEIAALLGARAPELARELLPLGRRDGGEWREARKRAGGLGDSLSVRLRDGVWFHGAAGKSGDALALVAYLRFDGDYKQAIPWARRWLGLADGPAGRGDPNAREAAQRRAAAAQAEQERRAAAEAERKRKAAFAIYMAAEPKLRGTAAEAYLAGRGIDLAAFGRQPGALRFHPALKHAETGREHPALVAAINALAPGRAAPDGSMTPGGDRLIAIHRTFLERRPDGGVVKLSGVAAAKLTLGAYKGGAVRIQRGHKMHPKTGRVSRAPALAEAEPGSAVILTEGLEDALTLALALPHWRVMCAVSLANLRHVALPPAIGRVVLAADNDAPGSPADKALCAAVEAHARGGRHVSIYRAGGGQGTAKDANALLQRALNQGDTAA